MILFVLTALAMACAVLGLLLRPLLSAPGEPAMRIDLNPLREQIRQLDALRDSGTLSPEAHAQARAEVERQIVGQVLQGGGESAPRKTVSPRLAAGVAVAVLALVGGGYLWLGDTSALTGGPSVAISSPSPQAQEKAPHPMAQGEMRAMVDTLAERLAKNPGDTDGWGMLARSYAVLGEHAKAVPAFRKAAAGQPDDAVLLADFADALAVSGGRGIEGESLALVQRALAADPRQPKALSLAGTAAFDRQDFKAAVGYWERLQQSAPPDHPLVRKVADGLAQARERAGLPAGKASPAAAGTAKVGGTVTLAAELARQASPEDTVFVFARAAQGPRMPLAVMRRQVKDLPLSFQLDDSLAMSPEMKLSSQAQVVVGARISKTGQAMPQPGDLVGESQVVPLGRTDVNIRIGEVVKP
jgi:cytochrome c-type biogenesis protein CcmH